MFNKPTLVDTIFPLKIKTYFPFKDKEPSLESSS